jgi:hypothetical protein
MKGRISCNFKIIFVVLLILLGFSKTAFSFQKNLSGNFNQPKSHVVTFTPGSDWITVDDVTGFSAGDTVLLIQMQGVRILTDPQGSYGTLQNKFGEPGMHEFLIILSVNSGTKEIVFRNNVINSFDPKGNIQIVRVPYFNSAVVTGVLTCSPWDPVTKSGGVLVMIIGRTIKLNANIDVSGQGFRGGKDTIGLGIEWNSNTLLYGKEYYPQSFTNAGYKGEGLAIHNDAGSLLIPLISKGLGPNFTGGGGGNGKYSGGGGGSNRGTGGVGGQEDFFPSLPGGNGGFIADHPALPSRIYMGGGGGASTTSPTGSSSNGGSGGGIIIIIADTITGNGGNVIARGNNGGSVTGIGGSGGGGGGGSIVLSVNSYGSNPISFFVNGGKGGDNPETFGEGAGGGGGLLWVSKNTSVNATISLSGGKAGNDPVSTATSGGVGEKRTTPLFKPNLNGFLFNSIRSSVSNDQIDSICSNMLPRKITGTIPVGGSTPYSYLWEKSYDQVTWIPLVNDSDPTNYTPLVKETTTVYFRRTITDSSPTVLVDVSKVVKIIVQPFIKNNIIGDSDTICFNQERPLIHQLVPDLTDGNNKSYYFKWQDSTSTASWGSSLAVTKDLASLAGLTKTSWFRRTVTSGRCIDSTAKVKITVLPKITGNNITSIPQEICFGMTFSNLAATKAPAISGGDNLYLFKWQSNINGAGWGDAPGKRDTAGYDPTELSQRIPSNIYNFRRIVYSGIHDVCRDTTATIVLKDYPVLSNNSITANQTIGHDSIPATLIGSLPVNGNTVYTFLWQYKRKGTSWQIAVGIANQQNYSAPALTDTTWYRRVVTSSACSDTSNIIVINVHKTIVNNTISFISGAVEDTVCNAVIPAILKGTLPSGGTNIPGDYSFQWYYSTNNTIWSPVASGGAGQDYQPAALNTTTWFKRYVSSPVASPASTSKSNFVKITVLPVISNFNIKKDTTICYSTPPLLLQGNVISGGDGTYRFIWQDSSTVSGWSIIAGVTTSTYQPPILTIPTRYKRIVNSGSNDACTSTSNVLKIGINPLPTGSFTPLTDTICEGSAVQLTVNLTGKSPWVVKYNENTIPVTLNALTTVTSTSRTPSITGTSADFNYALFSVQDGNLCFATSLTAGIRKSTVYRIPKSFAGNDTTVCGPKVTLKAVASNGSGKWYENSLLLGITPQLAVTIDSLFNGGSISHTFRWQEKNWQCSDKDSVKITFDKRIKSVYAGPKDTVLFSFDKIYHMVAGPTAKWENAKWTLVDGTGIFENDTLYSTKVTDLANGKNSYKWTVSNGTCSFSAITNVTVQKIVIPMGFSPNNKAGNENNTFKIRGLDLPNQEAKLSIVNGAGTEVFSTSNQNDQEWMDWDGKDSGGKDLSEGTYYYLLTIKSKGNDMVKKWSGFLILKRYAFH